MAGVDYPPRAEMRRKLHEMNAHMGANRVLNEDIERALDGVYGKEQRQPPSVDKPVVEQARDRLMQAKLQGIKW